MNYDWPAAKSRLKSFADLEPGWDTYNAPTPSELSIQNSLLFLEALESINKPPDYFLPTSDESIIFEIDNGEREWDFYNDGVVTFLGKENGEVVYFKGWEDFSGPQTYSLT